MSLTAAAISKIPERAKGTYVTPEHPPFVIIGGGPVGLAAAAHALARGLPVKRYEAGVNVGPNVGHCGHVRISTLWELSIGAACRALLERNGCPAPQAGELPTGAAPTCAICDRSPRRRNSPR
jgi:NADPH-dependent 2,4-dienoyl-CoA reductase/sulfur reductase-like enzyme